MIRRPVSKLTARCSGKCYEYVVKCYLSDQEQLLDYNDLPDVSNYFEAKYRMNCGLETNETKYQESPTNDTFLYEVSFPDTRNTTANV